MLAMQYSFTLPADYDMAIIRRRIADKGQLMDGFPHLVFKAFLLAEARTGISPDNLYAPFYLWHDAEGMNQFLGGSGFAAVTQSFGWPAVRTWNVWATHRRPDLTGAQWATREILPIAPYTALGEQRSAEQSRLGKDMATAIAAVTAYDPTSWHCIRFSLWAERPHDLADGVQLYSVGYVASAAG